LRTHVYIKDIFENMLKLLHRINSLARVEVISGKAINLVCPMLLPSLEKANSPMLVYPYQLLGYCLKRRTTFKDEFLSFNASPSLNVGRRQKKKGFMKTFITTTTYFQ